MLQPVFFLIVLVIGTWTSPSAAELQGWRTPDGKLYFGAEPPPGSTRFEAPTPTPRMGPQPSPSPFPPPSPPSPTATPASTPAAQPTRVPEPAATPQPAAVPTIAPRPRATPAARDRPPAAGPAEEGPARPVVRADLTDCGDFVEIRDTHPTIDFYSGLVRVSGEVVVKGGPVRDVVICIGGSCKPLAGGRALRIGETVPFSVEASRHRPTGLTVRCAAPPVR